MLNQPYALDTAPAHEVERIETIVEAVAAEWNEPAMAEDPVLEFVTEVALRYRAARKFGVLDKDTLSGGYATGRKTKRFATALEAYRFMADVLQKAVLAAGCTEYVTNDPDVKEIVRIGDRMHYPVDVHFAFLAAMRALHTFSDAEVAARIEEAP